jgi:hypothetical protein
LLWHGEERRHNYTVHHGVKLLVDTENLAVALATLASEWHAVIAQHASPMLFVHAGVVGWQGNAIVIPGRTMTGKTSIVAALVTAGADYYSDEYAVFDEEGRVHSYPKPMSLRARPGVPARRCRASEIGGRNGENPIAVRLVVATRYEEHARWEPRMLTAGQAVLCLLDNTICARTRTKQAIDIFIRVAAASLAICGDRPSSDQVVSSLLCLAQSKIREEKRHVVSAICSTQRFGNAECK